MSQACFLLSVPKVRSAIKKAPRVVQKKGDRTPRGIVRSPESQESC
ncbi:hypothetical protein [Microcoleus sp. Pol12B5]